MGDPGESELLLAVRLFAGLREKAGVDKLEVRVPAGTPVGRLDRYIRAAAPALGPYLEASRVAVNLAFAPEDQVLSEGDDVALIPPVSGG